MKVGDRVRITKSYYTEHPSRMKGGTGQIVLVDDPWVEVEVDDSPDGSNVWTFVKNELEVIT